MRFRIRLDGVDDTKVISFMSSYKEGIVVHHMVNDNPHYHFYLRDDMIMSTQAMRMRVKRYFDVKKSTDYSVKDCDEPRVQEYIQYLFNTKHGNRWRRVYDVGIGFDVIDDAISSAEKVSDEYEKLKIKQKRTNTISVFDMAEELAETLKDTDDIADFYANAIKHAIQIAKKYRKGMDYNMIIKIVTTYIGIVNEEMLTRSVFEYFSSRYR